MTVVAFAVLGSTVTIAAESGCEPPEHPAQPSAGAWKGYFRLIYELRFPGAAKLVVPTRIEGDLDFSIGRQQLDDPPAQPAPPPPPAKRLRRPLRVPRAAPSQGQTAPLATPPVASPEPPNELQQAVTRVEAEYNGLYVPPGKGAQAQGTSTLSTDARFEIVASQSRMEGNVEPKRPAQLEVIGEEDLHTGKFEEIGLWGEEGLLAFRGNFVATAPDTRLTGNADFSTSGGSGHAVAESQKRRQEVDFSSKPSARSLPPGVDQETESERERREFDEAYDRLFGPPKPKMKYLTLKVESTECWLMRGSVDTTEIAASMAQWGASLVVKESEWMVTLDERDPAFEERVQALADEPIPGRLTVDYINNFNDRSRALLREANSDYKRCAARGLEEKFIRMNVAALRTMVNQLSGANELATCAVLSAAMPNFYSQIRVLELYGLSDCSAIRDAESTLEKLVQDRVKTTLAAQGKDAFWFQHMDCLSKFFDSGLVKFGDQAAPFEQAWNAAVAARAPREE
jgi:hypothetical protein